MDKNYLIKIINFIQETEKLKDITRTGYTSCGKKESSAEHSWRLSLLTMLMLDIFEDCDPIKLISLSIVHDLGEIDFGDISAINNDDEDKKFIQEKETIKRIAELLPPDKKKHVINLWLEYNDGKTEEAKIIKALDKMETILQHNIGKNPEGFDYKFNLKYGRHLSENNTILKDMRYIVDDMTQKKIDSST